MPLLAVDFGNLSMIPNRVSPRVIVDAAAVHRAARIDRVECKGPLI